MRPGGSQGIKTNGGKGKLKTERNGWGKQQGRVMCVMCDKSSHAVKAFELTCLRAEEGLKLRF